MQWFSTGGHFAMSGDTFGPSHGCMLLVFSGWGARDAAKHSTTHRTDPTTENHLTRNINSVEKHRSHAIVPLTYQTQLVALRRRPGPGTPKVGVAVRIEVLLQRV